MAVAALGAATAIPAKTAPAERPTQYVVISFDGAREIEQWQRSRKLARESGASFSYFVSCVNLLAADKRDLYDPPEHRPGKSNVGFAVSRDDVAARLRQIWAARLEGHEIASHGCGHFDGGGWSRKDWHAEFAEFSRIMRNAWSNHDIPFEPSGWKRFVDEEIRGFRAPYLAVGPALAPALSEAAFVYDASGVSRDPEPPATDGRLAMYSLPLIPEGPEARPVIAMDYNLYVRHSAALERPSESALFEERAYAAFRAAFDRQYRGGRAPVQLGFHFRLMNDGAYWRALERFAREACGMPEVRCVSYRRLTELLVEPAGETARPIPVRIINATD